MAASVLFMLPVIILFFFAQKVFIEGVTLTGVKGWASPAGTDGRRSDR